MLRRAICVICTLVCLSLIVCYPMIDANLPAPPKNMTARPYEGWSGVIRVWVYQGFKSGTGSVVPWLNSCLSAFEKRNSGVYVQVETVSLSSLRRFAQDTPRPDMLVFTPGSLDSVENLLEIEAAEGIDAQLCQACQTREGAFAVPLCYGGYGMLINTADMAELPSDWDEAISAQYRPATKRKSAHYVLQIPSDDSWKTATLDMLGKIPAKSEKMPADYLECSMIKAWSDFKKSIAASIPASQWHLRQLELLDAEGKAPQWNFFPSQSGYTDQYFAASIVDSGLDDSAARAGVCRKIIAHITGEDSQNALNLALLFPALDSVTLYSSAGTHMRDLEAAYSQSAVFAPLFG